MPAVRSGLKYQIEWHAWNTSQGDVANSCTIFKRIDKRAFVLAPLRAFEIWSTGQWLEIQASQSMKKHGFQTKSSLVVMEELVRRGLLKHLERFARSQ